MTSSSVVLNGHCEFAILVLLSSLVLQPAQFEASQSRYLKDLNWQ